MSQIAIRNVNIITMNSDREIIENGAVVIKDGLISDIGDERILARFSGESVIDGEGGILVPGMVNAHTHVSMSVFRSLGDDVPDRLKRYLFPLEKGLVDRELVRLGAEYGIAEMLLGGVTTFADMYYYEDEVAKAADKMGIRAVLGETVLDFPSPDSVEPYGGLEYSMKFIESWKSHSLITPAVAPHAPYTNDTDHLKAAISLAEAYDVPILMHVAEEKHETEKYKQEYGQSPVEYLDSIGLLSERLIAAHCINVSESDIELLEARGVGISHNIGANSKGAKGVAPVSSMYRKGMRLGLGTDGPMSGNTLDIVTQMSLVAKVQKLYSNDRSVFPARDILEMATIGGARALHMDKEIGSIEVGKRADIIIFETKSVNMQPIYDYYSVLVYSANPGNVSTVLIDGNIVVENKQLKHHSLEALQNRVKAMKDKVWEFAEAL